MSETEEGIPESLSDLLEKGGIDRAALSEILTSVHPVDLADHLEDVDLEDRVRIFEMLDPDRAAQVLTAMSDGGRAALAKRLGEEKLAPVVDRMPDFAVADIMDDLPTHQERAVLAKVGEEHAADIQQLLQYPEHTAGGRMTKNFVTVPESYTARQTIQKIQGSVDSHTVDFVYVVDDQGALKGVSSLPKLMINKPETTVTDFMRRDVTFVGPTVDQEEVAKLAQKYRLRAVPVVDTDMRLLGVVTLQNIVDVIRSEADEDIMRLSGAASRVDPVRAPFFQRLKTRLPWLAAAMILELLIAWIMLGYEGTLRTLALAYFIPVIMAMGGSLGVQSSTLVVRGLATGDITPVRALKIVENEFWVGITVGLMAGLVTGLMAYAMDMKEPTATTLGFIVFLSMFVSLTVASTMGALTPLVLARMKLDPAVASGPFITAMNDVVNVTIYLTMAWFLIGETAGP